MRIVWRVCPQKRKIRMNVPRQDETTRGHGYIRNRTYLDLSELKEGRVAEADNKVFWRSVS